jgi:hypothetical protein
MLKCGRWQEFQKVKTWGKCSSWQMRNVSFSSLTQMTNFSPIQCLMWKKTWVYTNWIMVWICIHWSQDQGQRPANILLIFSMMMKVTVVPKSFKQSAGIIIRNLSCDLWTLSCCSIIWWSIQLGLCNQSLLPQFQRS